MHRRILHFAGVVLVALGLYFGLRYRQHRYIAHRIELLATGTLKERQAAEASLVRIGRAAVPQLVAQMEHAASLPGERIRTRRPRSPYRPDIEPSPYSSYEWERGTCFRAARALGRIRDPRAVQPLIDFLRSGRLQIRRVLRVWVEPEGVFHIEHDSPRGAATTALGLLCDGRAVPVLAEAANDPDWLQRALAAQALGCIGETRAGDVLIGLLEDAEKRVAWAAIVGLAEMRETRALQPLTRVFDRWDWELHYSATRALVEIAGERGIEMALEQMRMAPSNTAFTIGKALLQTGDPGAIRSVEELAAQPIATPGREGARSALRLRGQLVVIRLR